MCVDLQEKKYVDDSIKKSINKIEQTQTEKNIMRCAECNKKINITNFIECQCKKLLCYKHRYQTEHSCNFDFKIKEREVLSKSLVKIENNKIIKI